MKIFDKFKLGLSKSSENFSSGLNNLLFKKKIDENILNELEDFLIQSDVGAEIAKELVDKFTSTKLDPKKTSKEEVFKIFSNYIFEILKPLEKNLDKINQNYPSIILIAGVNGVGKTTTIGKLGKILGEKNKKVIFGAADTFRAAAVSQLEVWANRVKADIIKSNEGADPASVAYKTFEHAKKNNFDFAIIDTAGRLQTKENLMKELEKIKRIIQRQLPNYELCTILSIDAMLGQNSFIQAKLFHEATKIDGIVLTKMDGTAKGGIIFSIVQELKIPVLFLCFGEHLQDLIPFDSQQYIQNLLGQSSIFMSHKHDA